MLEWQFKVDHGRLFSGSAYFMFNDNKPVRRYIRYDNKTVCWKNPVFFTLLHFWIANTEFSAWHVKVKLPLCLPPRDTWHNMEVAGKLHVPIALLLGKKNYLPEGWAGPRASPAAYE
jgi:hypothetical protein